VFQIFVEESLDVIRKSNDSVTSDGFSVAVKPIVDLAFEGSAHKYVHEWPGAAYKLTRCCIQEVYSNSGEDIQGWL
jgi:hypothetical protein